MSIFLTITFILSLALNVLLVWYIRKVQVDYILYLRENLEEFAYMHTQFSEHIEEIYNMSPKERKEKGMEGLKWATSNEAGFTSEHQGKRFIEGMEELFNTWKPRNSYEFLKDTDFEKRVLKHKLIY